ncbi:unnamed protein product [Citrullus colocynthis]|uniref:Cytokinin riboside 5'-monophosphate phosphoribohydrolase n=1 Tax=Citrullus colocynthis TaxID=252529 RepID=A0ABP0XQ54_9ROSI
MSFSMMGSSGCETFVRSSHQKTVKFQLFHEREKKVVFKFSKSRCNAARALLSKHEAIEFGERTSPIEVRTEIAKCYELINRLGKGVVYLGSSRMGPDHAHYKQAFELSREISELLDCTTWSGVGPGLMDAVTKGALQAGNPVGGFKIGRESGEWTSSKFHPYLPTEAYFTCRFFSARKHGLVDAAVRSCSSDRTAFVTLPGGIGTFDEVFEILALFQLRRIGSDFPVPLLLMNYDSFYSRLLEFFNDCENWGTLAKGEVDSLWKVCDNNAEAVAYLASFYDLCRHDREKNEVGLESTH